MIDDLAIAFAMRCDQQGLSYEDGITAAERLAEALEAAAEDRASYLPPEALGEA